eukprot:scaffold42781_cov68-Phaeocystis_antarctica.AAC.2
MGWSASSSDHMWWHAHWPPRVPLVEQGRAGPRRADLTRTRAKVVGTPTAFVGRLVGARVYERARRLPKGLGRVRAEAARPPRTALDRMGGGLAVAVEEHREDLACMLRLGRADRGRAAWWSAWVRSGHVGEAAARASERCRGRVEAFVRGEDGLTAHARAEHSVRAVDGLGEAGCHGAFKEAGVQRVGAREGGAWQGARHELGRKRCRDVHLRPMPGVDLHRRDLELSGRVDDQSIARSKAVVRLAVLATVGTREALMIVAIHLVTLRRVALRAARLDDVVRHVPRDHPVQPMLLLELRRPGVVRPIEPHLAIPSPCAYHRSREVVEVEG